ncbi:unnamed protein product [Penicillium salamii]|uniref:Uncharacterized protein n=1 Tax=Penicillium salamii TaxID=1612424 RepID=A0A9W4K1N2_9EURO|nr:unnamed protein product [Penicillium salamii]CAG8321268.1 unnamed protein product [Penicillium salamii]CAG8427347.1 unnamed protein product [Penicillium salamii]
MGSISPYNLDPAQYKFPSPLNGWEKHTPLSESKTQDGKSYDSPDNSVLSDAYEHFVAPISNGGRHDSQLPGFDVHVYFNPVITPWAPDADGLANRPPARQISSKLCTGLVDANPSRMYAHPIPDYIHV